MRTRLVIAAAAIALVLAGCGKDSKTNDASKTTKTTADVTAAVSAKTIAPFGSVLTDANGRTLYFFNKDQPVKPKSACIGGCATNWPPLLTTDGAGVGSGLKASLLGQSTRDDGNTQYTYNGLPLYRFSGDQAAGDTNGQGVGGIWFIAGADGSPVPAAAATTTTAPAAATVTTAHKPATTSPPATSPPVTSAPVTSPPATSPPTTTDPYGY